MYMNMVGPRKLRFIIPTQEVGSPIATWTDVAFAYIRELWKHKDKLEAGASGVKILSHDGRIDLRVESRWHPFADWFAGHCPEPSVPPAPPTLVNVVIGAGTMVDEVWTPGTVNILITGHSIPPHKINWQTERFWDYEQILTMSPAHATGILEVQKRAYAQMADAVRTEAEAGRKPDPRFVELSERGPVLIDIVPPVGGANRLIEILNSALGRCA